MLSSSTPDLRECLGTSFPVSSVGRSSPFHRGSDKRLHGEAIKEIVPRPGSAPATKFGDCDSAFEEIGDLESNNNLGDIFSVLSIEDDARLPENDKYPIPLEIRQAKSSPQRPVDFNETPVSLLKCIIPSIAEVSGEDSDSSHHTSHSSTTSPPTTRDKHIAQRNTLNGGVAATVDLKPTLITSLRAPLVSITGSDDTSTSDNDSDAEIARFAFPVVNIRNIAPASRRRHSLAATTPDQITRMLLSHRRGSTSGLPLQNGDPTRTADFKLTASNSTRKPLMKQRSEDRETVRSMHKTLQAQTAQTYRVPTRRCGSATRSKSPFRVVTPRAESPSFLGDFRTVSQEDATPFHRSASPSGGRRYGSGGNLSPRPMSPRPSSPCRHRALSPRDEIEQILTSRSRSPSPRNLSTSSSIALERSRSPASRTPISENDHLGFGDGSSRSHFRSQSPRLRPQYSVSTRRHSYNFQCDDSPVMKPESDPQKTRAVHQNLAVHEGKQRRERSRSPTPRSLKPERSIDRRSSSPQPHHVRAHRPSHERRLSTRRSSKPDITSSSEELASMNPTTQSRRSSHSRSTSRVTDESDDSTVNLDRIVTDRRKRRGSRGKILPPNEQRGLLPANSLLCVRVQSRRSSISISHPTKERGPLTPSERAEIHSKLAKRGRRRSSWAGAGDPFLIPSMSALSILQGSGSCIEDEEQDKNKDPHILTLHFITDPGQSHPLQMTLRPLIESVVPKLKLFNFVERSESATRDPGGSQADHCDKTSLVPTLGVVLLLQEAFGMERILEAQKYLRSKPWELHHRGKVGSNNVPYPTNNQDFYAHQTREDSALWAVRQVHFGKDRLRFQLFVSDDMWTDTINFYSLLLSRPTHIQKEDFCYFLVFCSQDLNLEVQLALKKLPPGFKPQFLDSTILQFKVGDMCQLVPLLPRVCIPISDKRWQTADPDGNKVLLFVESGPTTSSPMTSDSPPLLLKTAPAPPSASCKERVVAPSCDSNDHQSQERSGHFEEWFHESNLVSAV